MIPRDYRAIFAFALGAGALSFVLTYAAQPAVESGGRAGCASAEVSALSAWLRLSPEQFVALSDVDATFEAEGAALEARLETERERLAKLFEDSAAPNEAILAQIEQVIQGHAALERRVATHLLALRPILTDEQKMRLFSRCATGVREARCRKCAPPGERSGEAIQVEPDSERGPGRGGCMGRGRMIEDDERPASAPAGGEDAERP